jgi:arginine repressor
MKRLLLAAFMAVLVVSGTAYAEDAGYMIKGKVVSVDMAAKTIVVDTEQGQKTILCAGAEGLTGAEGACSPNVKPGDNVEISCIDVSGKACAKNINVIAVNPPNAGAQSTTSVFEGEVVSVDPSNNTMVLKNEQGQEMTVRIQATSAEKLAPGEGGIKSEPVPMTELKPGAKVRVDCFDSEGKFCANRITVVTPGETAGKVYSGTIVSIDPEGKAIVISTTEGQKTLYYQESTTGMALTPQEVGKRVKAYCLDVAGKSCIRDITEESAP